VLSREDGLAALASCSKCEVPHAAS
jgi:hypothetical protein